MKINDLFEVTNSRKYHPGTWMTTQELLAIWSKYNQTEPSSKQLSNLGEYLNIGMPEQDAAKNAYYGDIEEARVPGLDYFEKVKSKKDPKIDRVILTLQAKDSEIMTKMAFKYKKLDNLEKAIKIQRDKMNEVVKTKMGELFDAQDVWYTRVIDTVSATMTLARRSESTLEIPAKVETQVNWEQVALEVMTLLDDELLVKGKEILSKYTEVVRIAAVPAQEPKSPALIVKAKNPDDVEPKEESINEGKFDKFKAWAHRFLQAFKHWGANYDKKLAKINAQMGVSESVNEEKNIDWRPPQFLIEKLMDLGFDYEKNQQLEDATFENAFINRSDNTGEIYKKLKFILSGLGYNKEDRVYRYKNTKHENFDSQDGSLIQIQKDGANTTILFVPPTYNKN